jgi:hypothetical protein
MVHDLEPARNQLTAWDAEWIATDEINGPRRYFGGAWVPLLRKDEREFVQFIGIDARGRYLFSTSAKNQPPATLPSTHPTTLSSNAQQTLIIDPTLPDPIPRLPVWRIVIKDGTAGWTANGWPAQKEGTHTWALGLNAWRSLDNDEVGFLSGPLEIPALPAFTAPATGPAATSRPATQSTTSLTTAPFTIGPDEKPILRDDDGNWYFDGKTSLKVVRADGSQLLWPLPPSAIGEGDVFLVRTAQGLLFLFNQPGRALRIRPTPDRPEPFVLEATFTRSIPNTAATRIWLDPFNRIVIAHSGNQLSILFPEGFIPVATEGLIVAAEQDDQDE